jgi:hypothetical protein
MAHFNQMNFIKLHKDEIREPVLIVASKMYDYDNYDIRKFLVESGFKDITGIDLFAGEGVDHVVDITDSASEFIRNNAGRFNTIYSMELLTNVNHPFKASANIMSMLKQGGTVLLSEVFVRKISRMPLDLWRFTYEGHKELFSGLSFNDSEARMSVTRDKADPKLYPYHTDLFAVTPTRNADESAIGYFLRRLHRKFFAGGIFRVSRLFPEITIYSIARKK